MQTTLPSNENVRESLRVGSTRLIQPILLVAVATALAAWSWGTWPDVFIDFGRELYIAWQITSGKTLYRDIAYYNGPLSPYLNTLWFKLFGVSLRTLIFCNLAVLAAITALLHHLLRTLSDRFTATIACLVFLCIFAFSQYVACGNYNYVCPYSHDAVHGLTLTLAAICLLKRCARETTLVPPALCGFLLGLVFLTRAEVFTAALIGLLPAIVLTSLSKQNRSQAARRLAAFSAGLIFPVLACVLLFLLQMPLTQAVHGTLGSWPALLSGKLTGMNFFKLSMGTDQLAANLVSLATWAGWTLAAVALMFFAAWCCRRAPSALWPAIAIAILTYSVSAMYCRGMWVFDATRSLPLWTLVIVLIAAQRLWKDRDNQCVATGALCTMCLGLFSLGLLVKIVLFARVYQYGFLHAMPAYLLCVVALVYWIPRQLDARGRSGLVFRVAASSLLAAITIGHLLQSHSWISKKSMQVGSGSDAFRSDPIRGQAANYIVSRIHQLSGPGDTLVALPEGVMLNYLARRTNPTPHTNFMPTEMEIFGEQTITDSVMAQPPDWIALAHKDTSEFGVRFFGTDYARPIAQWVSENYYVVDRFGEMPLVDDRYGILLMRRNEPAR